MASIGEHIAARIGLIHARRVYHRFHKALTNVEHVQQAVLAHVLKLVGRSAFGKCYGLDRVRSPDELRRAVPLLTYEDLRPYIDRLREGDSGALFSPRARIVMFATSSGTMAKPKYIPVTSRFVEDYRRGWNTFGLKMLSDHPAAALRAILQSSSRSDASYTAAGVPCGAITGLLARTQKRIVRRFYVGRPEIGYLSDPQARYYALMRLGLNRDVAFAVTANPATLVRMARVADENSEVLIRDVHDGTIAEQIVTDGTIRRVLQAGLRAAPARAKELVVLRERCGHLRPRDCWKLEFLACWTGGSMGHYLERLADWYGPVPVRDVGLLASEGRVSIPLEDNTPAGALDVRAAFFEFIPVEQCDAATPGTLTARELQVGQDYVVVLSNSAGLVRYRLDDVVRVRGWLEEAPVVEFLYRAGRVSSVAGEKLTENQVVTAVRSVCAEMNLPEFDYVLAPCWDEPPFYRLNCAMPVVDGLARSMDTALAAQNEEYASRRKSLRLGELQARSLPAGAIAAMDRRIMASRESSAEQYKRPCLLTRPGADNGFLAEGSDGGPPTSG
ncbi:MAG: GH3 auxin-responsive promoter family protein [Planctomycetes bacterium]|nr:GH3 auxin-responsive promoter family protein [Planctomycetota bacterium]